MMPVVRILHPIRPDCGCVRLTRARPFTACLCSQSETFVNCMRDGRRLRQAAMIAVSPEQLHRVKQNRQDRCQVRQSNDHTAPHWITINLMIGHARHICWHINSQRVEFSLHALFDAIVCCRRVRQNLLKFAQLLIFQLNTPRETTNLRFGSSQTNLQSVAIARRRQACAFIARLPNIIALLHSMPRLERGDMYFTHRKKSDH